jgi:Zn-dependent alcohol dehydrogenase
VINARKTDAGRAIREICPNGVEVFIDNTGIPAVIETGYHLTRLQGRVTLSAPHKGNNVSIYSLPLHFGKSMSGSHGEAPPHEDIPRYQSLYRKGVDSAQ